MYIYAFYCSSTHFAHERRALPSQRDSSRRTS
jgi:hypothetical protein